MFKRLPGNFEKETLLWIHAQRFPRRNAEEQRVETVHFIQESAIARVHFSGGCRIGIVDRLQIPTRGRNFCHRVDPVPQQPPERLWIVRASWETATDPDNRDGVAFERGFCFRLHCNSGGVGF